MHVVYGFLETANVIGFLEIANLEGIKGIVLHGAD
jgi:hypothetical protein